MIHKSYLFPFIYKCGSEYVPRSTVEIKNYWLSTLVWFISGYLLIYLFSTKEVLYLIIDNSFPFLKLFYLFDTGTRLCQIREKIILGVRFSQKVYKFPTFICFFYSVSGRYWVVGIL